MRRYLLPVLTWPALPRLPCLSAGERRGVLEASLRRAEAAAEAKAVVGDRKWIFVPVRMGLFVSCVAGLVWWFSSDALRTGATCVAGALLIWAHGLGAARLVRPHLTAELRDRGGCTGCGYDLRGKALTCPECGKEASWPD